jgi:type I restriction enzyme M protein
MVDTPWGSLRDFSAEIFMGTNLTRLPKSVDDNVEVPVIHVKDVSDGTLPAPDDLERVFVSKTFAQRKHFLRPNDVLVSARGTLLKTVVVSPRYQGSLASANFIVVRLKDDAPIRPQLLYAFLRQQTVREFIMNRASGTAQPVLAIRELENLAIPVPTLSIQDQLVRLLEVSEEQRRIALECARLREEETMEIIAKFMDPKNATSR